MNLLTTQCNYSNLHLIITHFITILPRVTNTRRQRERGGGSWLAWEKGLGLKARSYRRPSSHSSVLVRLRRRRPKVGGQARSARAGAGADAALATTQRMCRGAGRRLLLRMPGIRHQSVQSGLHIGGAAKTGFVSKHNVGRHRKTTRNIE